MGRSSATLRAIVPSTKVVRVPLNAPRIKSTQHRKSLLGSGETLLTVGYASHTSERTGVASRPEWKITAAALVHPLQLYTTFLLPLLICLFVLLLSPSLSLACVSIFHPHPPFWMETLSRARKNKTLPF